MKFITVAIVLAVAIIAAADLHVGEQKEDDVLLFSKRIFQSSPIGGQPPIALSGWIETNGIITAVHAVNAPGTNASVKIVQGHVGTGRILVGAMNLPGFDIDAQLDVYATSDAALIPPAA